MKSDQVRSQRLNYLLKVYLKNRQKNEVFHRAKRMGVSDTTAKDYLRTVIIQAMNSRTKTE
jgi:hypothetical protein